MAKEITKGEQLKKVGIALKKIKLKEPSTFWKQLEMSSKSLRDI